MLDEYRNHHYVAQWYQKRFMAEGETELLYLNLRPDSFTDSNGTRRPYKAVKRQGSKMCFVERDLYTTKIHGIQTTDIEKQFFGDIDANGLPAVKDWCQFPLEKNDSFNDLILFMSTQKLRTPKGLAFLSDQLKTTDRDTVLRRMIRLRQLHCAIWTECVWQIADASASPTKFILSDHPVTVYNRRCGPKSSLCRDANDPEIWLQGTHTIFPLSLEKILILTNLSWVRNPYQSAVALRPNPVPLRGAIFKMTDVHDGRHLSEEEVRQINFIIKSRAYRYVAAAKEDWLYPERHVSKSDWNTFGHGYLLMPDPRWVRIGGEILWGNSDGSGGAIDEYGRRPWDRDYNKETKKQSETRTLGWFQGEFAQLFGPQRRGMTEHFGGVRWDRDSDSTHQFYLGLQKKFYKERKRRAEAVDE